MKKKIRLFSVCIIFSLVVGFIVFNGGTLLHSKENNMKLDRKEIEKGISSESMIEKKYKVVIDPGHGGADAGAEGASGRYEKDFTLSVAKKVEKLLEQESQIEVFMTRTDDSYISQESRFRPKYANELNADVFISIHGNTFDDPSVSGTEVFYYHKNSLHFAEILQKNVVKATGFRDRGAKKGDLFVVRETKMPAALIEVGYLTNPGDESKMWTDGFQNDVANAIVEGIKEYLGI